MTTDTTEKGLMDHITSLTGLAARQASKNQPCLCALVAPNDVLSAEIELEEIER
jgi:hypothetical protein